MDYKSAIKESLTKLQNLTPEGSEDRQVISRKLLELEKITSKRELFFLYQTLREVLAEEDGQNKDVHFIVKSEDGKNVRYENLDDFYQKTGDAGPAPSRTQGDGRQRARRRR